MILKRKMFWSDKVAKADKGEKVEYGKEDLQTDIDKSNLVSSIPEGQYPYVIDHIHYPVIDVDLPVYAVPSKTPGHTHLYIEKEVSHKAYRNLLKAMLECGLIEQGYYDSFNDHGATFLRRATYDKLLTLAHQPAPLGEVVQFETPEPEAPTHKTQVYIPSSEEPTDFELVTQSAKNKGYKWTVCNPPRAVAEALVQHINSYVQKIYTIDGNDTGLTWHKLSGDNLPYFDSHLKTTDFKIGDLVRVMQPYLEDFNKVGIVTGFKGDCVATTNTNVPAINPTHLVKIKGS